MGERSQGDKSPPRGAKRKREITLGIKDLVDWFGEEKNKENEEVFVHIKAKEGDHPMMRKNQFLVAKYVKEVTDKISKASFNAEGDLILKVKGETEANKLIKLTKLGNWEIKAERHKTLNSSKGVIFNPDLCYLSEEEIKEGLQEYKAKEVYIFKRTPRDNSGATEPKPFGLMTITFDTQEPPKKIKYGFEYIEVRKYVPNPKRCKKCQKLGHTTKWCKNQQDICAVCGDEKTENHSCTTSRCVNCSRPGHASNSRDCPTFLMHKEWEYIMVHQKLSKFEARKFFFSKYKDLEGFLHTKNKSLAEIMRDSTNQTSKNPKKSNEEENNRTTVTTLNAIPKDNIKDNTKSQTNTRSAPTNKSNSTSKAAEEQEEDTEMTEIVRQNSVNNNNNSTNNKLSMLKLKKWKHSKEGVTYLLDNNIKNNIKPKLDLSKFKGKNNDTNKKFLDHANKVFSKEDIITAIMEEVEKHKSCKRVKVQMTKTGANIETFSDEEDDNTAEEMVIDNE